MDDTAPAVASEWNASEALYAFMGWLTSRYERTVLSATDDAAPAADLIGAFCKRHDLPKPREGFTAAARERDSANVKMPIAYSPGGDCA